MSSNPDFEVELLEIWREVTNRPDLAPDDNFLQIGGTPALAGTLVKRLEEKYNQVFHACWLLAAPTVRQQARWMESTWMGGEGEPPLPDIEPRPDDWRALYLRRFAYLNDLEPPVQKNPSACFILSPGRSGSTLLRAMLAGHPDLFAPPELELSLSLDLQSRHENLQYGWLDLGGLESGVRYLWGCTDQEAALLVDEWRNSDLSTLETYRRLQEKCAPRLLVDQTTSHAAVASALKRLEQSFDGAYYIHLQRHPLAMIRSWLTSNFAQVVHASPRCAAEINWLLSHQNILEFLKDVPTERKITLQYEDLVTSPETQMRRLTDFLGLEFHLGVLNPYQGDRMTQNSSGRFSGDKKFLLRTTVDAGMARSSRRLPEDGPLLEETEALARRFGYRSL